MRLVLHLSSTLSLTLAALLSVIPPVPAVAQEQQTLGYGRLFSNDYFGDGRDRWRTGSYSYSILRGTDWDGAPPAQFGALREYRFRTEIIAPARLNGPGSHDRPYVGIISAGMHSHFSLGEAVVSAGVDLVMTGPQTRIGDLQEWFHEKVDAPRPAVLDSQLGDGLYPTALVEIARPLSIAPGLTLRPFAGAQLGAEDLLRVGLDFISGRVGHDALWLRDSVTGQLVQGVEGTATGFSFVGGVDFTQVGDSVYLPAERSVTAKEQRLRSRIGVHWQMAPNTSFFYGLTWLSEEFESQPEGQLIGSLKLNFNF